MKKVVETKKTITIKEVDVTNTLMDCETGEVVDLNELIKKEFSGDCIKITLVKSEKEEE